jgi:hypothetical protein
MINCLIPTIIKRKDAKLQRDEKRMLNPPFASLRLCVYFFKIQWLIMPDPAACDLTYL